MKEALKLALELKNSASAYWTEKEISIIEKLIDALAQPEQEPVALVVSTAPDRIWLDLGFDPQDEYEVIFHELHDVTWSQDNASGNGIEYVRADTTPPKRPWVGLTDEEMSEIAAQGHQRWKEHAQAIDAALQEKNI